MLLYNYHIFIVFKDEKKTNFHFLYNYLFNNVSNNTEELD